MWGKIVKKDQGETLFASQLASYHALDDKTKDKSAKPSDDKTKASAAEKGKPAGKETKKK